MKVNNIKNDTSFKSSTSLINVVSKKGDDSLTKLLDRDVRRKVEARLKPTIDNLNKHSGYKERDINALKGDDWLAAIISQYKPFKFNSGKRQSEFVVYRDGSIETNYDRFMFSVEHEKGDNELDCITVNKNLFGLYSIKSKTPITIAGDWKSKHIFTWDKETFVDSLSNLVSEQIEKLLPKSTTID